MRQCCGETTWAHKARIDLATSIPSAHFLTVNGASPMKNAPVRYSLSTMSMHITAAKISFRSELSSGKSGSI